MAGPSASRTVIGGFSARRAAVRTARLLRDDRDIAAIISAVAEERAVNAHALLQTSRGTAEIALARQLAMYLAHTLLGRTMEDVGDLLGRDRTTVAHACRVIEDRREKRDFDRAVERIESAVRAQQAAPLTEGVRHAAS